MARCCLSILLLVSFLVAPAAVLADEPTPDSVVEEKVSSTPPEEVVEDTPAAEEEWVEPEPLAEPAPAPTPRPITPRPAPPSGPTEQDKAFVAFTLKQMDELESIIQMEMTISRAGYTNWYSRRTVAKEMDQSYITLMRRCSALSTERSRYGPVPAQFTEISTKMGLLISATYSAIGSRNINFQKGFLAAFQYGDKSMLSKLNYMEGVRKDMLALCPRCG